MFAEDRMRVNIIMLDEDRRFSCVCVLVLREAFKLMDHRASSKQLWLNCRVVG